MLRLKQISDLLTFYFNFAQNFREILNISECQPYQSTVAAVNKLDFKSAVAAVDRSYSRDDEIPEEGLDGKACFDQVAAVSKSFKSNYSRTVKCHNCGFQHPAKQCPAMGKTSFSCGKRNHFANLCKKSRQSSLNKMLAASEKSNPFLDDGL